MVVIDHFSKFVEFHAINDSKAPAVADIIVNEWCCRYGIPEQILSDGGKQYQSTLLELVYDLLDIRKTKTTAFHPQCDGQSEKTIQTLKNMVRAYIDENQEDWDTHMHQFAFAYNSAVHASTQQTPFEMMFGRCPKIPIDLLYPNTEVLLREPILKEYQLINEVGEVTVLEDHSEIANINAPIVAKNYLIELRTKMRNCFATAETNRNIRMNKAKINHDRNIRRHIYHVGELVLTDHPRIKKGLSHGLALKLHGPFKIIAVNENKCDYFIQLAGAKKAKIYQVHQNRLAKYFHAGRPFTASDHSENKDEKENKKRTYNKNPDCQRWRRNIESIEKNPSDLSNKSSESTSTDEDSEHSEQHLNEQIQTNSDSSSFENSETASNSGSEIDRLTKTEKPIEQRKKYPVRTKRPIERFE
jgi:hypothetical protein